MQRKDENPKPSRPSLLTPAQQAEADRNRILTTLESGGGAAKPAVKRSRSWLVKAGLAVAVLGIAVVIGVWLTREAAHDELLASIAAASKETPPAAPAAAAATAATPATPAEVSADEVLASAASAATINEDHAAQQAPEKPQSLSEMLGAGGEPAPKPSHDVLSKALETPSSAAARAAARPAAKVKPKPVVKEAKATVKDATAKAPREPENTPEQERDVALLSALMAHAEAAERTEPAKKPKLSLKEQLAQCKKFSKAKAAQCHERICDGRSKTGECKVAR